MSVKRLFEAKPGEKIEMALHRHPITFLKYIFFFVLLAGLPIVLAYVLLGEDGLTIEHPLARVAMTLLGASYYLGIWLFFFTQFVDHYLDISIVTDRRVIDIDQQGLFGRSVSELNLGRVQDVNSEVKGIIPTLFNYGRVTVQTASDEDHFIFDQVHRPHHVRQRVLELAAVDRKQEAHEIFVDAVDGTGPSV